MTIYAWLMLRLDDDNAVELWSTTHIALPRYAVLQRFSRRRGGPGTTVIDSYQLTSENQLLRANEIEAL